MGACKKCRRDHAPVSLAEWTWQMRDLKPKPPGAGWVLWMLASHMDPRTGCGFASRDLLAADANVSTDTVDRALTWAQDRFILYRAARGHRVKSGVAPASEWRLISMSQLRNGAELATDPTPQSARPNSANKPTQLRTGADPGKTSQATPSTGAAARRTSLLEDLNTKARAETGDGEVTPAT